MSKHYPLRFTLEDGVHVEVNKAGDDTYDFMLGRKGRQDRHFTLIDTLSKDEIEASMDFDQLNAVRRFWLERGNLE